ncbi:MAG: hypothetical protein EOP51_09765 [Sphingobacteriales bacterium]|nr:MAG: hypothetical protein EOP51_09765 [Sphingobacteriales bacterium]
MMKQLLTALAIPLALPIFAQEYKTACEVPDILKEGYKGKVKKVTRETYDIKNINGKLIREKLTEMLVDSYDATGFLRKTIQPILHDSTMYQYDSENKPVSCIYYDNGHPEMKKLLHCIDKYSYEWVSYEYDKTKKQFSKAISNKELTVLNTNFLFDRKGKIIYNYFTGTDTVVYNFPDVGFAITITALEKDAHGNIVISLVNSGGITEDVMCIYKYEYYQ